MMDALSVVHLPFLAGAVEGVTGAAVVIPIGPTLGKGLAAVVGGNTRRRGSNTAGVSE